jgi:hypothetical protein
MMSLVYVVKQREEPDLEFGVFSVFYVEPDHSVVLSATTRDSQAGYEFSGSLDEEMDEEPADIQQLALVRVDLGENLDTLSGNYSVFRWEDVVDLRSAMMGTASL